MTVNLYDCIGALSRGPGGGGAEENPQWQDKRGGQ